MSNLPLADTVNFLYENSIFKDGNGEPTKEQIEDFNINLEYTIDYSVNGLRGIGQLVQRMADDEDSPLTSSGCCDVGNLIENLANLIERCLLIKK